MLAVMPLHVRESHFTLTDVPTTFLVVLTLLLSLRAHERATRARFLAGGGGGTRRGDEVQRRHRGADAAPRLRDDAGARPQPAPRRWPASSSRWSLCSCSPRPTRWSICRPS
jgi:hypothetical protein